MKPLPRTSIVSFRLREEESASIKRDLQQHPIPGIKSFKQFTRKLLLDYVQGKLVYINPYDKRADSGVRNLLNEPEPHYGLKDAHFVEALSEFIKKPENWRDLKFFMTTYKWPEDISEDFHSATTSEKLLEIARGYLAQMLKRP